MAGLPLIEEDIDVQLRRRQQGYGRGGRMAVERDHASIIAGVRHGKTLGSPIALVIENRDWENWRDEMACAPPERPVKTVTLPRPGHADYAGAMKYGTSDLRNIMERASARETAMRVALGAVARRLLDELGICIAGHVVAIGDVQAAFREEPDFDAAERSPVRCADEGAGRRMQALIDRAAADGDSLGGVIEVLAFGVPIGLGSHVQADRRLDAAIAGALMSIPAIKGVENGEGFALAARTGTLAHDAFAATEGGGVTRTSNRAGGIEGGISNGMPLVWRAAMKPIPTLRKPLPSVDLLTGLPGQACVERADVCAVPSTAVVAEAVLALELARAVLEKYGGDSLGEVLSRWPGASKRGT